MINREATIRWKGYDPDDLSPKSGKRVWCVCDKCGKGRWLAKSASSALCMRCGHAKSKHTHIIKLCKHCGKEIEVIPCLEHRKQYCSNACKHAWKIENMKGDKNHFYGKKHTDKSREKISNNHADVSGTNNPMHGVHLHGCETGGWKGGASSETTMFYGSDGYKIWREGVFARDDYTCQECGALDKLCVHHILPYRDWKSPQYSSNVDNGITLCKRCHGKTCGREYEYFNKCFDMANGVRCADLMASSVLEAER